MTFLLALIGCFCRQKCVFCSWGVNVRLTLGLKLLDLLCPAVQWSISCLGTNCTEQQLTSTRNATTHDTTCHLTWNAPRRTCIQVVKRQQLPTPSYSAMSLQNWRRLLGRWQNIFRKTDWETNCLCFKPVAVLSLALLWRGLSGYFVENHEPQTFLVVANYQHPGPWSPFLYCQVV